MSESRPYDQDQLAQLTAHVETTGNPVINAPEHQVTPGPGVTVTEPQVAFLGISRLGRQARADRLQHRISTVRAAGEAIDNPRGPAASSQAYATQKIGWEGVHKREIVTGTRERDPDDFTNLGAQLFRKKPTTTGPNPYRPASRSEKRAAKHLSDLADAGNLAASQAAWLRNSYSPATSATHALSGKERRRQASIDRQASRLERKAQRKQSKFNKITGSNNLAGRVAQRRLSRNSR